MSTNAAAGMGSFGPVYEAMYQRAYVLRGQKLRGVRGGGLECE